MKWKIPDCLAIPTLIPTLRNIASSCECCVPPIYIDNYQRLHSKNTVECWDEWENGIPGKNKNDGIGLFHQYVHTSTFANMDSAFYKSLRSFWLIFDIVESSFTPLMTYLWPLLIRLKQWRLIMRLNTEDELPQVAAFPAWLPEPASKSPSLLMVVIQALSEREC